LVTIMRLCDRKKSEACVKDRPDLYRLGRVQYNILADFLPVPIACYKLLEDFRANLQCTMNAFNSSDLFSHIKTAFYSSKENLGLD
jgi:hypothetical protein